MLWHTGTQVYIYIYTLHICIYAFGCCSFFVHFILSPSAWEAQESESPEAERAELSELHDDQHAHNGQNGLHDGKYPGARLSKDIYTIYNNFPHRTCTYHVHIKYVVIPPTPGGSPVRAS